MTAHFLNASQDTFSMDSRKNLETNGKLIDHPLAELLVEIAHLRLNGSLRISNEAQKAMIYFDAGDVVFAASNSRFLRLYEILLRENKITKEQLVAAPDFTNDFALAAYLLKEKTFTKPEIDEIFTFQIEEILRSAVEWQSGEWIFSPLVRAKGDIRYKIGVRKILIEHARNLSAEEIDKRFADYQNSFGLKSDLPPQTNLSPQEAFVYSRFESDRALSVEQIFQQSGLPKAATLQAIYALWLGGFIYAKNSNAAFSEKQISAILSAKLSLVKEQSQKVPAVSEVRNIAPPIAEQEPVTAEKVEAITPEKPFSVEEQLQIVENAADFYEVLGVGQTANLSEIKNAYFALAKRMHPDLFHQETDAKFHRRIQDAFTKLAHVYETLKTPTSREVYDFKMRKELAEKQKSPNAKPATPAENLAAQASENFDVGFGLLMEEDYENALPYFIRAVHFAPGNARFHAYYGKALSHDQKQRHKAESELQTAIKLDSENAVYRLMLAEFFVQVGLMKRAEGELNRLLAKFPGNKEARALLDSLQNK